jgi:hypothetical protein
LAFNDLRDIGSATLTISARSAVTVGLTAAVYRYRQSVIPTL